MRVKKRGNEREGGKKRRERGEGGERGEKQVRNKFTEQ